MTRKRDTATLDLFREFRPAPVVARFEPEAIRAASLTARMARAVAQTLKDDGRSREAIAAVMSEILGETVKYTMLDAYASQGKADHRIPAERLIALVEATQDPRALNALLADSGLIAVPAKYEALIRREVASEARERIEREIQAADAAWRAGR